MRVPGRSAGQSLPELLVCTLIVGLMLGRTLAAYSGLVDSGDPTSRGICGQNKLRLSATLVAWQGEIPGRPALSLPEGYSQLRQGGWLEVIPFEPGTRSWSHTYRTTPGGKLVCEVHDLGRTRDPALGEVGRVPELEFLAACLLVAAYLVTRWVRRLARDPLGVAIQVPTVSRDPDSRARQDAWEVAQRGS